MAQPLPPPVHQGPAGHWHPEAGSDCGDPRGAGSRRSKGTWTPLRAHLGNNSRHMKSCTQLAAAGFDVGAGQHFYEAAAPCPSRGDRWPARSRPWVANSFQTGMRATPHPPRRSVTSLMARWQAGCTLPRASTHQEWQVRQSAGGSEAQQERCPPLACSGGP